MLSFKVNSQHLDNLLYQICIMTVETKYNRVSDNKTIKSKITKILNFEENSKLIKWQIQRLKHTKRMDNNCHIPDLVQAIIHNDLQMYSPMIAFERISTKLLICVVSYPLNINKKCLLILIIRNELCRDLSYHRFDDITIGMPSSIFVTNTTEKGMSIQKLLQTLYTLRCLYL